LKVRSKGGWSLTWNDAIKTEFRKDLERVDRVSPA